MNSSRQRAKVSGDEWKARLRAFFVDESGRDEIPPREELTDAQEMQCRIVGGALIAWLERHGPRMIQERSVLRAVGFEPNPLIVFTSNVPGLVAAREILGEQPERVVYMTEARFRDFLRANPDPRYIWHVHHWSLFPPQLEAEFLEAARSGYPIADGCQYWQHVEGTLWGPSCGLEIRHLWQWDGAEPALLEEGMQSVRF